jgi:hypothetical protein
MYLFSFHYTATFDALYFDNLKVISDHSVKIKINHLLGGHSVISEEKNCHPPVSLFPAMLPSSHVFRHSA